MRHVFVYIGDSESEVPRSGLPLLSAVVRPRQVRFISTAAFIIAQVYMPAGALSLAVGGRLRS